jgi:hypothetical protein
MGNVTPEAHTVASRGDGSIPAITFRTDLYHQLPHEAGSRKCCRTTSTSTTTSSGRSESPRSTPSSRRSVDGTVTMFAIASTGQRTARCVNSAQPARTSSGIGSCELQYKCSGHISWFDIRGLQYPTGTASRRRPASRQATSRSRRTRSGSSVRLPTLSMRPWRRSLLSPVPPDRALRWPVTVRRRCGKSRIQFCYSAFYVAMKS